MARPARALWSDSIMLQPSHCMSDVTISARGEVAERFMAAVLKTVERKLRGFESLPLRQDSQPAQQQHLRHRPLVVSPIAQDAECVAAEYALNHRRRQPGIEQCGGQRGQPFAVDDHLQRAVHIRADRHVLLAG
jgi:hypothetical protein